MEFPPSVRFHRETGGSSKKSTPFPAAMPDSYSFMSADALAMSLSPAMNPLKSCVTAVVISTSECLHSKAEATASVTGETKLEPSMFMVALGTTVEASDLGRDGPGLYPSGDQWCPQQTGVWSSFRAQA